MIIRALSVRQPWAFAIVHLGKDIENRTWRHAPKCRGIILIHAAKAVTRTEYESARFPPGSGAAPPFEQLARGGIVGAAELYDILPPGSAEGWAQRGCTRLMLRNATALPFRPLKGMLGFFGVELTDAEADRLRAAGLLPAEAA